MPDARLDKTTVISNYIKTKGVVSGTIDAALSEQLDAIYPIIIKSHKYMWDWDFLEIADQELSFGADAFISFTGANVVIIKSARVTSAGVLAPNPLYPISKQEYDIKLSYDGTTTTNNPTDLCFFQRRLYPYPKPTNVTKIVVSGIFDIDSSDAPIDFTGNFVPGHHEEAIHRYLDYKLGESTIEPYLAEVRKLGGKRLKDLWGNMYGNS